MINLGISPVVLDEFEPPEFKVDYNEINYQELIHKLIVLKRTLKWNKIQKDRANQETFLKSDRYNWWDFGGKD